MYAIRTLGRVFNGLLTTILAFLLISNLYTIAVRQITGAPQPAVFGWSWAVVISGSMEPEFGVHDLVVVHEEDAYSVGDIVTYQHRDTVVTHRIIDTSPKGFITKGDSNNTADMFPVPYWDIIGKVAFVVPGVGLVIEFMKTPLGMTCMVLIGFLLIEIPYLIEKKGGRWQ